MPKQIEHRTGPAEQAKSNQAIPAILVVTWPLKRLTPRRHIVPLNLRQRWIRREWLHFADCIHAGAKPRTPLSDGLADLDLAVRIIQAMPPKQL
ncbi:hypothetical protein [Mesorhizobium sp. M7A.F.Ca.US.008.03.1.1]|uniref:hypothetical protein n=1 Tax=Mesorhizobium sp. M7A.F.Ca.US.008.03.1.1 TaxID=2496742 RepID=UPI001FDF355B|nr:hypothetical protein [Mesorhizobium sp. M7A.F.Ca.US.008.03.1.1]